ncbi:MAG: radical SAM family heme chaperone HemW [Hydrogenophaga sp.]|nr:radical SAM family heme chaperone HemW [Hydrogenophaga sp.]MDO8905399.1 radical SAM family heme chaperone HemW [Hydrogenophaga sp.]
MTWPREIEKNRDKSPQAAWNDVSHWMRPGTLQLQSLPPLSLYVHLPWCLKKCPYCDFNSHEWMANAGADEPLPEARYLDALRADLEASLPLIWGRPVHSVFIGGGTPSLFSPAAIDRLLGDIRSLVRLDADAEITLEANPGTFEKDRFRAFHKAGVTRLSIGVQSFNDQHLKALGRVHNADQAMSAVEEAARSFETFNLDIMYALPGQSLAQCEKDIRTALSFSPPHISIYHLTLEPNTYFAKYPPALPQEDDAWDMLDLITEATGSAGLERYEVSAYARGGHRCWHNTNYWQFGDYLGIGAGAHSKLSFAHRIGRPVRVRDPRLYMDRAIAGDAVVSAEEVARKELPFEFMLNALRLRDGFTLQQFSERTGLPLSSIEVALQKAQDQGFVTVESSQVKPTIRGFDFLSDLQTLFLAD